MSHVVLKYKDSAVGLFAAVVPEGVSEDEVVDAWHTFGWSRASKAAQGSVDELLNAPPAADPAT